MKTKYLKVEHESKVRNLPNFDANGSIKGMKNLYYGKDALLVRCGSYIYNVSNKPDIYYKLAR